MGINVILKNNQTGMPVQYRTVTMQDWDQGIVGNLTTDANGALVVDEQYRNKKVIFHTSFLEPGEECHDLHLGGWIPLNQDTIEITVPLLSSAPGRRKGVGITIRLKLANQMGAERLGSVEWVSDREHLRSIKDPLNLCAQTVYRESIFGKKVTGQFLNSPDDVDCQADENGDIVLDEKYFNDELILRCEIQLGEYFTGTLEGGWKKIDAQFFEYSHKQILKNGWGE